MHFILTGCRDLGVYTIDMVIPGRHAKRINNEIDGIESARYWIANYLNDWNQWKLESYLQ